MADLISKYLSKISLSEQPIKDRIKFHFEAAKMLSPENIEQIFISERLNKDGTRSLESLWFFTNNYCLEAKNFVSKDSIDITPIDIVYYLQIAYENYNFKDSTEDSRLYSSVHLQESIYAEFRASGINCDILTDVIKNRFKPKLSKRTSMQPSS